MFTLAGFAKEVGICEGSRARQPHLGKVVGRSPALLPPYGAYLPTKPLKNRVKDIWCRMRHPIEINRQAHQSESGEYGCIASLIRPTGAPTLHNTSSGIDNVSAYGETKPQK